jgi:hypothetical protein
VAQHALKVFRVFHAGVLEGEEWGVRMFPMVPYDILFAFLNLFLIACTLSHIFAQSSTLVT